MSGVLLAYKWEKENGIELMLHCLVNGEKEEALHPSAVLAYEFG